MIERKLLSHKTIIFSLFIHIFFIIFFLFPPFPFKKEKRSFKTYKVNLSYIPAKKSEIKTSKETSKTEFKGKRKEPSQNVPKKIIEKKKEGMKPLKSKKKEEIFPSKEEETPSFGGTKVMSLDAPYFPFNYYLDQVLSFISSNWYKPPASEGTYCSIYFIISRSGRIIDAKIENSSGNPAFDRAALRAVLASNPLPPLPYDYYEDKLGIHLRFQ